MTDEDIPGDQDPHNDCRVKRVIAWGNGMCMVFCEHGKQMPRYQGYTDDMKHLIWRDHPDAPWEGAVWNR